MTQEYYEEIRDIFTDRDRSHLWRTSSAATRQKTLRAGWRDALPTSRWLEKYHEFPHYRHFQCATIFRR